MALPEILKKTLRIPVVGAPLFIISHPPLVLAQCKAGIVGSFPALNARPASLLDDDDTGTKLVIAGEKRLFLGNLAHRESQKQQLQLSITQIGDEIRGRRRLRKRRLHQRTRARSKDGNDRRRSRSNCGRRQCCDDSRRARFDCGESGQSRPRDPGPRRYFGKHHHRAN